MSAARGRTGNPVPGYTSEIGDRIKAVIEAIGTLPEAGAVAGVSDDQISAWRDGRSRPNLYGMMALCSRAGKTLDWLFNGDDDSGEPRQMGVGTQPEQADTPMLRVADPSSLEASALVMVPLLDVQASAGSGRAPTDEQTLAVLAFGETYLRDMGINPRSAHVIQVSGQSMFPTLVHEDLVLVDTSIDHVRDEALYAVVYGNLVLIKRVRLGMDGSVTLSSDNKAEGHTDLTIKPADLGDLHIAGRVCGRVSRM